MKGGRMNPAAVRPANDLLRRIQCEFLEMPGLRLTEPQARRLWNLDATSCSTVVSVLIEGGFLFKTPDGSFMHVEQAKPLKTELTRLPAVRPKFPAA
jgi:hypothetical protein